MWLELWVRRLELSKEQCSPFQVHQHHEDSKLHSFFSRKSFSKSACMPPHAYTTLEHAGPPLPLWPWEPTAVCMCQLCSLDASCILIFFGSSQVFPSCHSHIRLGSLRDRWCVALKPPNFAGAASPPMPSLESKIGRAHV